MKKTTSVIAALALSGALVAGLTGCVTVNVSKNTNDSNASTSQSSTAANSNTSADKNANQNGGSKNSNSTSNASSDKSKNSNTAANSNSSVNSNTSQSEGSFTNWTNTYKVPADAKQKVGKKSTGYISVPQDWKDRTTDDFDERQIEASDITYVVDPTTEFTSMALSHYAFWSSIKMETFMTDFASKASEIVKKYEGNDDYFDMERQNYKLSGKNASMVKYSTSDGCNVYFVTVAKDEATKTCTMFTVYAQPSQAEYILGYLGTWGE